MDLDTDLAPELERAIPTLSGAPATAYLALGRRARRRRRAAAGLACAAVLAVTGGALMRGDHLGLAGGSSLVATQPPSESPSAGADDIPGWAQEYGNHGPVAIAPDGALWVAPDARLVRSVEIPVSGFRGDQPVVAAYAAEAEMGGKVWWSFVYRVDGARGVFGEMDEPGRWTTDLDVWVDDVTARLQGRLPFAERLVRFAGEKSDRLVGGPGVEVVAQATEVTLGSGWVSHPRRTAAQVVLDGRSWFVLAEGPRTDPPYYSAYEPAVVGADDLAGFLAYLTQPAPVEDGDE